MFTDKDKKLAKALIEDTNTLEFIAKVFLAEDDKLSADLIKSLPDEELGQFVRANFLAEVKVKQRFERIKRLGGVLEIKDTTKKVPA